MKRIKKVIDNTIDKTIEIIKKPINKITIIGAGAFGFAFARLISLNSTEKEIFIFDVNEKYIDHIKKTNMHPIFHEDSKLPDHVRATTNLKEALDKTHLVILAVPSKYLRNSLIDIREKINCKPVFLSLTKGLDPVTGKAPYEIIKEELGLKRKLAVLSGGMIAREVILENPLAADLACKSIRYSRKIIELISSNSFKVNRTKDVIGVSYAGILKNVIAISAGIVEGLGYQESSRSALISCFAKEMTELAINLGANKKTYSMGSQAWMGDLMTSCFGGSRNRAFGIAIGKGEKILDVLIKMKEERKSVEGYHTTKLLYEISKNYNTPLLDKLYNILYLGESPKEMVDFFKG